MKLTTVSAYITDPPSYLQIGFGLVRLFPKVEQLIRLVCVCTEYADTQYMQCQDVSELRAFTEFKSRGGRFM